MLNESGAKRSTFAVVVHVALIDAGRVFLLRRARTGFMDGHYVLPGGYQEAGESVLHAAQRECLEECGVTLEQADLGAVLPFRHDGTQGVNFLFLARRWRGEPGLCEPARFDAAGFFALDALPASTVGWVGDFTDALRQDLRLPLFREYGWN